MLMSVLAYAGSTRNQQADALVSTDTTKTWSLPSSSSTLMSNPMTTANDLIYGGTSGAPTRLAIGTSGYVLTSNGSSSAPSWQAASGGTSTPNDLNSLSNAGLSLSIASNALTVTLTQSNGSSAPTSSSPVYFSTLTGTYGYTVRSVTSTLAITAPAGGTLGIPNNGQAYFIWVYLIWNGSSADICLSGINPTQNISGNVQFPEDLVQQYFTVAGTISSSSTTAGSLYCSTATAGSYAGHLIGRIYAQSNVLNSAGQWSNYPNIVTLAPVPHKFYGYGSTYQSSSASMSNISSTSAYTFTITSSSMVAGDTYGTGSSPAPMFMVSNSTTSSTTVTMMSLSGNVTPATSGTLTQLTGTGPSSVNYSARTIANPQPASAASPSAITYIRDGDMIDAWINYYSTATTTGSVLGSGDYGFQMPFPISTTAYTTGGGKAYQGGTAQSTSEFAGVTSLNQYKIQAWGTASTSTTQVFNATSAVPFSVGGQFYAPGFWQTPFAMVRILGTVMNTSTGLTASEVPMGSTYIPMTSNIAINVHVRYAAALGIYGP